MIIGTIRLRRWTAGVGGLIGHFDIHVPTVHFHAIDIVVIGKRVKARHRSNVALIPVVAWKDFIKWLRLNVRVVLNVARGQIRLGLHICGKEGSRYCVYSGNDVGVAVGICLLARIFCT